MAHTPGPWSINGWDIVQQDCDNTFPRLAKACNGNRSLTIEAINANACLIAAAPELLAALKGAKDELIVLYERAYPNSEPINDTTAAIDLAIDAIAKAEGRMSDDNEV